MNVQHRASQTIVLRCEDGQEHYFNSEQEFNLKLSTGAFLPTDNICYERWTSGRWLKISECSTLDTILNSLGYEVGVRLRQRYFPVVTAALCLLLAVVYLWSSNLSEEQAQYFVLGWAHVLLDDHWWSPWTSQFLHGSKSHVLSNMIFLGFLGVQVERAIGHLKTIAVLQLGLLLASVFIVFMGTDPVIGASIWNFALWGAVFMIGWRFENSIPDAQKYRYGWWSFLIFVPVYVLQIRLDVLSHLGHLGGLLGGICAAACVQNGKWMAVGGALLTGVLCHLDPVMSMQEVKRGAVNITLPQGFREIKDEGKVYWKSYPFDEASVEIKTTLKEPKIKNYLIDKAATHKMVHWNQGFYDVTARCHTPSQNASREHHCVKWLSSAAIQETQNLQVLREVYQNSQNAKDGLNLSNELVLFGLSVEADQLLSELWLRDDAIGFEARKIRIWIRALDSEVGDFEEDKDWLVRLALSTPTKDPLREWVAIYLFEHGEVEACQIVGLACQSLEELMLSLEKTY